MTVDIEIDEEAYHGVTHYRIKTEDGKDVGKLSVCVDPACGKFENAFKSTVEIHYAMRVVHDIHRFDAIGNAEGENVVGCKLKNVIGSLAPLIPEPNERNE